MNQKAICAVVAMLVLLAARAVTSGQYASSDSYTRYELLAPETHQFKIYYEVTETTPGARFHFNPIRTGSDASDEAVFDMATGKPLKFEVVTGKQAKVDEPGGAFNTDGNYIKIHLAHPVAARGEYRIRRETDGRVPLIVLMHGDCEVSTKALARTLGVKSVSPCEPAVAQKHTSYMLGGTSPFATRRTLPVYVERTALDLDKIYINGGKRGFLVSIDPVSLRILLRITEVDVAIRP